ncbi:uncharacterized protein PG998_010102 [Apiospora kogelbergensis]|uniref:Uncharacterized protein n=1 Tax=Apiospora kogelbergensis TaxID=1337665 RepID=A0AAW0R9W6_9PEZI
MTRPSECQGVPQQRQPQIDPHKQHQPGFQAVQKSFRFWVIIVGLGIMMWLAALENTVLTTEAPVVQDEIHAVYHRAINRILYAGTSLTGFGWLIC